MTSKHGRLLVSFCGLMAAALIAAGPTQVHAADAAVQKACEEVDALANAGPYAPTWESLRNYKEAPEWYKDAKLGVFLHWGVYSVPAFGGEWYPRWMYVTDPKSPNYKYHKHHLETYGPVSEFGYKDFIPQFTADKFNADEMVALFKEAGIRYVVPVAEHHDGFAMYDCGFSEWDAVEKGPKRDLIREFEQATKRAGLKFGVSSHRAFNWAFFPRPQGADNTRPENFGLYGRSYPFLETVTKHVEFPPHDEAFKDDWLARSCELVKNYDLDLMWFDFGIAQKQVESYDANPFQDHLKRFTAYYYNTAAKRGKPPILNYKFNAFPEDAAVLDLERSKMDRIRRPFWQTDTAVSTNSWGYIEDHVYKPVNRIVDDLVDIVSKNGCLLLNVGPKPDGTLPEEEQRMLREIGAWLGVNGEAIYGTRPWKLYGEGPTETVTGHVSEGKNKAFTAEDVRFTVAGAGGALYATLLGWPEGPVMIRSLANTADGLPGRLAKVELLGSTGPIAWEHTADGLRVELPAVKPCEHAFVLKLSVAGLQAPGGE